MAKGLCLCRLKFLSKKVKFVFNCPNPSPPLEATRKLKDLSWGHLGRTSSRLAEKAKAWYAEHSHRVGKALEAIRRLMLKWIKYINVVLPLRN